MAAVAVVTLTSRHARVAFLLPLAWITCPQVGFDGFGFIVGVINPRGNVAGQFPDARHWCNETRRRFPANPNAPECELFMMTTRAEQPDIPRAWRLADSMKLLGPRPEYLYLYGSNLAAAVIARAGNADSARRVIDRSRGNEELDATRELALVGAFAALLAGDRDKAIDLLRLYFTANPQRRESYANDPGWWFRPLADDPGFKQLVGTSDSR